jgi:hypothetical protein
MGREQTRPLTARSRLRVPHHAWMSGQPATNIDAADPTAPMISSPSNLDGGVGATELFKSDWYVWLIATKNRG